MLQPVITKHTIDGRLTRRTAFSPNWLSVSCALPLRMSEPAHRPFIEQCIVDFGLCMRDGPGLSVVIPFPRVREEQQIGREQVLAAVTHNYFYPIPRGG